MSKVAMSRVAMTVVMSLCLGLSARPAFACKVVRRLTPGELVADAAVIVRAKAVQYTPPVAPARWGNVTFRVLERLKGRISAWVSFPGDITPYFGPNETSPPYTSPRPGGLRGACFAYDYKLEAEFLLFLNPGSMWLAEVPAPQWSPYWAPLAPPNEEVHGPDDAWVVWVRTQLATPMSTGERR